MAEGPATGRRVPQAVGVDPGVERLGTGHKTGKSFPGTENVAVASTGLGCVVFEVPQQAKITEIQFTLDSGGRTKTGQWKA